MGKSSTSTASKSCSDNVTQTPIKKKEIVKRKVSARNNQIAIKKHKKNSDETKDQRIAIEKTTNIKLCTDKKFICQICHNKFSSHKKLIQHFREHGKIRRRYDKPTQCDTCPMIFPTQTKAIQHKHRVHPNIPNSFCQFCGKLFVLRNSLEEHLTKDHQNPLPESSNSIKCDYCSAMFSNATALQYHVKSLHQQINYLLGNDLYIPPSSTKIIRSNSSELFSAYYCHLCGVEYMIKNSLKKHLYTVHSAEDRTTKPDDYIKCKTCEAIFFSTFAYEKHLVFHKPGDLYAANQEERMRVVSRVDQDFDIGRVPFLQEINTMLKQMTENNMLPTMGQKNLNNCENSINLKSSIQTGKLKKNSDQIQSDTKKEQNVTDNNLEPNFVKEESKPLNSNARDENKCKSSDNTKHSKTDIESKIEVVKTSRDQTIDKNVCNKDETKNVPTDKKPPVSETIKKNVSAFNVNISSLQKSDKISKPSTSVSEKSENKIVIKSKTNSTMEIVDSQNKVIVLKKVVLKKKPTVKVKNKNESS